MRTPENIDRALMVIEKDVENLVHDIREAPEAYSDQGIRILNLQLTLEDGRKAIDGQRNSN